MYQAKLISYIITDLISKSEMKVTEMKWHEIIAKYADKFEKAGVLRQFVNQIWDKENILD